MRNTYIKRTVTSKMNAKSKAVKRARRPRNVVTLKIVVKAPGLTPSDVVEYATRAIDGWGGMFAGDDPRTKVRVVEIQRLGWITEL